MRKSPRRSLTFPGAALPEPAHLDELSCQQPESADLQLSDKRVPTAASEPAHTRPGSAHPQDDSAAELHPEQCSTPRKDSQSSAAGFRMSTLHSSEVLLHSMHLPRTQAFRFSKKSSTFIIEGHLHFPWTNNAACARTWTQEDLGLAYTGACMNHLLLFTSSRLA